MSSKHTAFLPPPFCTQGWFSKTVGCQGVLTGLLPWDSTNASGATSHGALLLVWSCAAEVVLPARRSWASPKGSTDFTLWTAISLRLEISLAVHERLSGLRKIWFAFPSQATLWSVAANKKTNKQWAVPASLTISRSHCLGFLTPK